MEEKAWKTPLLKEKPKEPQLELKCVLTSRSASGRMLLSRKELHQQRETCSRLSYGRGLLRCVGHSQPVQDTVKSENDQSVGQKNLLSELQSAVSSSQVMAPPTGIVTQNIQYIQKRQKWMKRNHLTGL